MWGYHYTRLEGGLDSVAWPIKIHRQRNRWDINTKGPTNYQVWGTSLLLPFLVGLYIVSGRVKPGFHPNATHATQSIALRKRKPQETQCIALRAMHALRKWIPQVTQAFDWLLRWLAVSIDHSYWLALACVAFEWKPGFTLVHCHTALSSALANAVGGFTGGLVMSRLKLRPVGAVKLIIIVTCAFTIGNAILLFLGCPQVNMAGQLDSHYAR